MFTAATIASELLPFINRIVSPDLKPVSPPSLCSLLSYVNADRYNPQVNSQLIKKDERLVLMKLVNHLLTMKMSFVQDRNEEGQLSYKLDP